jgi:tetratricopeptide (TPR) repeat protein
MTPFLRDTPDDPAWTARCETLRCAVATASPGVDRARALGRLGDELRRDPAFVAEAIAVLTEAIRLTPEPEQAPLLATNLIRLATAQQYAGDHDMALTTFAEARRVIARGQVPELLDYVAQHEGKCLVEMGRPAEARDTFAEALRLRRQAGATALIASTLRALAALETRPDPSR